MIRLFGNPKRLCDGITRRDLLHIGGLTSFGLTVDLVSTLKANDATGPEEFASHLGRAKSCILIFLFGSPAQHETFDPKPLAPLEVRGEMGAIQTSVPGLMIGEGLPRTARVMDKLTVIRSVTHEYPTHGVAYAVTGMPTYTPAIEDKPHDGAHWPFIGSIVDYVQKQRSPHAPGNMPYNIGLPWPFGSRMTDKPLLSGPYGAFLGSAYDPVWTTFDGKATTVVPKLAFGQTQKVFDHFGGIEPSGRFDLSASINRSELDHQRLKSRASLLEQFDQTRSWLERTSGVETYAQQQRSAFTLLTSRKIREALDIQQESEAVRAEYGMTLFGQSALAARRLVEAGSKFVSLFWDPVGPYGISVWDTHENHFPRLKQYLLPVFDQTYPALISDLDKRGLLDDTLVVCISEHGRTPKISSANGGGRDHWSQVYSAVLAGGGVGRGNVVGRSDRIGGEVEVTPVSPKDILATTLFLLGIGPDTMIYDRLKRPHPVAGSGVVRSEFF